MSCGNRANHIAKEDADNISNPMWQLMTELEAALRADRPDLVAEAASRINIASAGLAMTFSVVDERRRAAIQERAHRN